MLPTDTPLLPKPQGDRAGGRQIPEGQWDVSHGRAGRGHLGPWAPLGLTRGQRRPSELAQPGWLVLAEREHGAFQLCQPHRAASTKPRRGDRALPG